MIHKLFEDIEESDLLSLIENQVLEGKTLDYKLMKSGNKDSDKKEFLADVSSFANASGGDLIYGIREDKGIPIELKGLNITNEDIDNEILAIENLIRQGIEPRISGIKTKSIKLSNENYALMIRIPKSWRSPHAVTLKGTFRFYGRSSNGKYPFDVSELRNAFNLTDSLNEKITRFREERLMKIISDEGSFPLGEAAKIVLHIIPVEAFNLASSIELKDIAQNWSLPMMGSFRQYGRYNIDGICSFMKNDNIYEAYSQLFRNGIVESVTAEMLQPINKIYSIPSIYFENEIMNVTNEYINELIKLGINYPFIISMSLLNAENYHMSVNRLRGSNRGDKFGIDRNVVVAQDIFVEQGDIVKKGIEVVLKPIFDSIWNACGYAQSLNYDESGNYKARERS